ncbi:hypothetical protein KCU97_g10, partial [Aureobasidium melanogenum]
LASCLLLTAVDNLFHFLQNVSYTQTGHPFTKLTIPSLSLFVTKVRGLLVEPCVRDMLVPAIFRPIPNALIVVTAGLEALRSSTRVPVHLGVSESVETLCIPDLASPFVMRGAARVDSIDWSLQWSKALSRLRGQKSGPIELRTRLMQLFSYIWKTMNHRGLRLMTRRYSTTRWSSAHTLQKEASTIQRNCEQETLASRRGQRLRSCDCSERVTLSSDRSYVDGINVEVVGEHLFCQDFETLRPQTPCRAEHAELMAIVVVEVADGGRTHNLAARRCEGVCLLDRKADSRRLDSCVDSARGEKVCVYGVGRTGTKNATRRIPRMSAGGSSNTEPSLDSGVCGLTRNREDRLFEGEFVEFSILLEPHKPASPSILEHDKEARLVNSCSHDRQSHSFMHLHRLASTASPSCAPSPPQPFASRPRVPRNTVHFLQTVSLASIRSILLNLRSPVFG